jgi:multidrug efflux pump
VPKGFFPQQDTGQINGGLRADQSISFQAMQAKLKQVVDIIRKDPAVDTVVGFTGGSAPGAASCSSTSSRRPAHRKRPGRHRAAAPATGAK